MEDLLHKIHGRAEWHSSTTRRHDSYQRCRRFFVQFIWAVGGWNFVMPSNTSYLHLLETQTELQINIFLSQCLVCRVGGGEFSPVWSGVGQRQWPRYEVWCGLWSSLLPQHFFPPSSSHIPFLTQQITQGQEAGRKVTVRSHKVLPATKKKAFILRRHCILQYHDCVGACTFLCNKLQCVF